jgi:aminoglycoside phosphotransferase (APT) family kinase protein
MSVPASVVEVLAAHRFDEGALADYLRPKLEGIAQGLTVRQFQGGQSNPTFLLEAGGQRYVLRKKPPGKLLPSAHQVEREYKVLAALKDTDVPVPPVHLLCEDASVIGTAFYVMDYVPGRLYSQPTLAEAPRQERAAIYEAMADTLARLHRVDWQAVGLADFGRPSGYVARQIKRWSGQYEASRTGEMPAMEKLMAWLPEHIPAEDETAIAHGDFRPGNLLLHPERPEVVAVLDWELATLGHPLADLAYCCMPYHLPAGVAGVKGLVGLDLAAEGLPPESRFLAAYRERVGRQRIEHWNFFLAFSLFRLAAILQGVYHRALQGNASNADALEVGQRAGILAEAGWRLAQDA